MFILGLFCFIVGSKVIIRNKPIVFRTIYPLILMLLFFISISIFPMIIDYLRGDFDLFEAGVGLLLLVVVFVFMIKYVDGFQIIGINDDSFRKCLSQSLDKLNLEYEEKFSKIIITKHDLTILCSVQSLIGQAQIQFKGQVNKKLIRALILEFNRAARSDQVSPKKVSAFLYAVIGLISVLISFYYLLKVL
jgi:hypothetical protein